MDGASYQLFSGARLTEDQDGGTRGSHFRNLQEDFTQCFGGANDFLEHGRTYDFFAQCQIFALDSLFSLLAIFDISRCHIPMRDASLSIEQWIAAEQKPVILPVSPQ